MCPLIQLCAPRHDGRDVKKRGLGQNQQQHQIDHQQLDQDEKTHLSNQNKAACRVKSNPNDLIFWDKSIGQNFSNRRANRRPNLMVVFLG